jgi:hypothetical protein
MASEGLFKHKKHYFRRREREWLSQNVARVSHKKVETLFKKTTKKKSQKTLFPKKKKILKQKVAHRAFFIGGEKM